MKTGRKGPRHNRGAGNHMSSANGIGARNEIWRIAERLMEGEAKPRRKPPPVTLPVLNFQRRPL